MPIYIKRFFSRYGKYIIRIGGITGLLLSVFLLVSGIYFLSQESTSKDSQDFFPTWKFTVQKDSYAVVLEPDGIDFDGAWDMGEIGTFKVVTDTTGSGKDVFIGIAPVELVRSYLDGIAYDKITGLWIFPPRAEYQGTGGENPPGSPGTEEFWSASSFGKEISQLTWNPEQDNTSLVLMNADGSPGIDLDVQVKTKAGILFIAGAINLMAGVFFLLLSLFSILYAGRAPNTVYPGPLILPDNENKQGAAA